MKYFETIKCEDYEVFNLDFHNFRIAKTIGKNIDLNEYIYPPNNKLLRCKVVYDDSEILSVDYFEYKRREIKSFKLLESDIDYSKKYLDRSELDDIFLEKDRADEVIIIKNSLVSDTSIANIAIYDGTNWLTPKEPLLEGTTRRRYIKEAYIIEKDINVDMLMSAKKIALMNAMVDFYEIKEFEIQR